MTHAKGWIHAATGDAMAPHQVVEMAIKAPAVLLGEQHDRADHHQWQLHVTREIYQQRRDIVMGFEMFPARLDPVLADWVKGDLDEPTFLERAEWKTVWGFDPELYLPLFRFCKEHSIEMIGLNCRRNLVKDVGALGWDGVPVKNREGITPALPATAAHRDYLFQITGGLRDNRSAQSGSDPNFDRFVRAQQTWDRAFACRIARVALRQNPPLVIGIIGRGHLEYHHGTPAQLDDLGVVNSRVFLPMDQDQAIKNNIGDAVYCLPSANTL